MEKSLSWNDAIDPSKGWQLASLREMIYSLRISNDKLRLWIDACRGETIQTNWSPYEFEDSLKICVDYWSMDFVDHPLTLEYRTHVFRDIVGNPFMPILKIPLDIKTFFQDDKYIVFHESWITKEVGQLALVADIGDWSVLGPLSDALEEGGCESLAVLEHLRSDKKHYKGCWVIDLLLNKE